MFMIISLDYGDSSTVKLHLLTSNEDRASHAFDIIEARYKDINATLENGHKRLLELIRVPEEYEAGHVFFWGSHKHNGVTVLRTNNL